MSEAKSVEPVDPAKKTSEIIDATAGEATVKMDQQDAKCYWNDAEFSQGERVDVGGTCYECNFGRWLPVED